MKPLQTACLHTPVGWIELQASDTHLRRARWVLQPLEEEASPNEILQEAIKQMREYFAGQRKRFDLPLQQEGAPFQQKVWSELQKIPYGETISYKALAALAGNGKACRAAGSANAKNSIFIIVPCHRVIQSDGNIGGYAYGTAMKSFLLEWERKNK
ncbi:MAG: methylated-DNA--protein-cysteine methyltransferase [Bacteroidales bacterium]